MDFRFELPANGISNNWRRCSAVTNLRPQPSKIQEL